MVNRKLWISIIILLWVLVVISAYYVFHKPVVLSQVRVWLQAGSQVLCGGAILGLAGGIGKKFFPLSRMRPCEAVILQGALGLGFLGTGTLGVGALVGYQRWVGPGLFVVLLLLVSRSSLDWWRELSRQLSLVRKRNRIDQVLMTVVLVLLGAGLLRALAPPLKFDSLVYHLSLPVRYLKMESFSYLSDNVYWGMPQLQEMLFVISIGIAGLEAGPVLGWWIGAFSLLSMYLLVERHFGSTPAWVAVVTLIGGLSTARSLSWGYNLWLNVLWGSSFLLIMASREETLSEEHTGETLFDRDLGYWGLAGLVSGFALGTKYTSGLLVIIGMVVLIFESTQRSSRRYWTKAGGFLLIAGAAFSPWLIKNLVAVGNPVYPFFFPGGSVDSWRQAVFSQPDAAASGWQTLGLPIASTVLGVEGAPGYGASIGPFFLALGAVGFFSRPGEAGARRLLRFARLTIITGLIIWAAAGTGSVHLSQTRLYAVLFPAGAVLAAAGFKAADQLQNRTFRLGRLVLALIFLVAGLNLIQVAAKDSQSGTVRHFLGVIEDQEYLTNNLGWYAAAVKSAEEIPEVERMIMLWEPRGLYCLPECDSDEYLDRWHVNLREHDSGPAVIHSWVEKGFTHVLYYHEGAEFIRHTDHRFSEESWATLEQTLNSLVLVKDYGGVYQLYSLRSP